MEKFTFIREIKNDDIRCIHGNNVAAVFLLSRITLSWCLHRSVATPASPSLPSVTILDHGSMAAGMRRRRIRPMALLSICAATATKALFPQCLYPPRRPGAPHIRLVDLYVVGQLVPARRHHLPPELL